MSQAISMTEKHCGNQRVRYCKCDHDQKRHFQGYKGANTGNCKNCKCNEYKFKKQMVFKVQ